MTVEELYKYCVRKGYEDKEIKINVACFDTYYAKKHIPVEACDLFIDENVEICISV